MKWHILYTEQAKEDLQRIYEYIAYELLEPVGSADSRYVNVTNP